MSQDQPPAPEVPSAPLLHPAPPPLARPASAQTAAVPPGLRGKSAAVPHFRAVRSALASDHPRPPLDPPAPPPAVSSSPAERAAAAAVRLARTYLDARRQLAAAAAEIEDAMRSLGAHGDLGTLLLEAEGMLPVQAEDLVKALRALTEPAAPPAKTQPGPKRN